MTSGPIKSRQILTDLDLRNNTIYDANIPYKQHYYEYETSLDNISGAKEGDIAKIEETDKIIYYKYHNGAWVLIQDPDTELSETSTNTVQNQAVTKVILDNEKVVAAMGNDLNDRILNIDNKISTINTNVETITVGKGTTTERPAGKTVGYQYFDTTLNKPIWYTGTTWVDSTGATV